jgi:hypothetical protein
MRKLRNRIKEADGSVSDYYLDDARDEITVRRTFDLEPQIRENQREYDPKRRGYKGDMEKVATVDARAIQVEANRRGVSFGEFMQDKKAIEKFVKDNPVWKTRPSKRW